MALGAGFFEFSWEMRDTRLPLEEGERIVRLENYDVASSRVERLSMHDFLVWRNQLESIEQLGAYRAIERNLITARRRQPARRRADLNDHRADECGPEDAAHARRVVHHGDRRQRGLLRAGAARVEGAADGGLE
jgi:hypothetical protein